MTLYTIGFTQKGAERFFSTLAKNGVLRVLDVRLNNRSQLAGFAKRDDLRYFLHGLCGIGYQELPSLAPTPEILSAYKKNGGDWATYERQFLELLDQRRVAQTIDPGVFEDACLLCSEHEPTQCHRRLIAEYLREQWGGIEIRHLT